jgi:hypothetical protein
MSNEMSLPARSREAIAGPVSSGRLVRRLDVAIARRLALQLGFAVLIVLVLTAKGPIGNNSDYWRVASCVGLSMVPFKTIASYHVSMTNIAAPAATLPAMASMLFWVMKPLYKPGVFLLSFVALLNFIYFAGFLKCFGDERSGRGKVLICVVFAVLYTLYGFYFVSFYEEAAVLALAPWLVVGLQRMKYQKNCFLFFLVSILVLMSKVEMLFAVPVMMSVLYFSADDIVSKKSRRLYCEILLLLSILAFASGTFFRVVNGFDRYYNGIGWAVQDVSVWPANAIGPRLNFYYSHRAVLQKSSNAYEADAPEKFFGTSFWPTISNIVKSPGFKEHGPRLRIAESNVTLGKFAMFFVRHPDVFPKYVSCIYRVTWGSDYSLNLYKTEGLYHWRVSKVLGSIADVLLSNLGKLYAALGLALLLIRPRRFNTAVTLYFFLGAPVFAVIGDGYFEFERHMAPYFMLLPLLIFMKVYGAGERTA